MLPSICFCFKMSSFYFSPLQNAENLHIGEKQELLGVVLRALTGIAELPQTPKVCSFPVSGLTVYYQEMLDQK